MVWVVYANGNGVKLVRSRLLYKDDSDDSFRVSGCGVVYIRVHTHNNKIARLQHGKYMINRNTALNGFSAPAGSNDIFAIFPEALFHTSV